MKRILLIFVTTCIFSLTYSQTSKLSVGLEFTPTIEWFRGNSMNDIEDHRFTYSIGLNTEFTISTLLSLKSGISYERKGLKKRYIMPDEDDLSVSSVNHYFNFDYLVLPVLFSFSKGEIVKVYLDLGPYFGYLLRQETISGAIYNTPEQSSNDISIYNRMDFGLSFGTGIAIPINSKISFNAGIKADIGLIDIMKTDVDHDGSVKTNSLGLQVGIKYNI